MPHVNNLNFPVLGDNFGKQKQNEMNELSILRELVHLVLKKLCISPESQYSKLSAFCTCFYGNRKSWICFQSKPHLNISAEEL